MTSMESCVVHGPRFRSKLEGIINRLRSSGLIDHLQAIRLRSVVCSCLENSHLNSLWTDLDTLNELSSKALDEISSDVKRLSVGKYSTCVTAGLVEFLYFCDQQNSNVSQLSLQKLLILFHQMVNNNFYHLNNCLSSQNVPSKVYHTVQLSGGYVGLLIGKGGHVIKSIRKETQCNIQLVQDGEKPGHGITLKLEGCNSNIQKACSTLDSVAKEISTKRAIHLQKLAQYHKKVDAKLSRKVLKDKGSHKKIDHIKDLNRYEYSRLKEAQCNRKHSHEKVKGHRLLAEGSRCLNCWTAFSADKLSKKCRHHPGYVVKRAWTCCMMDILDENPSNTDHEKTGCVMAIHNFRPTQKRSGKVSLNSDTSQSLSSEGKDMLKALK